MQMMSRKSIFIFILLGVTLLLLIPNISNAAVDVSRNIYANNGSAKYEFTGLTLDKSHEYEFGLTKTSAAEVEKWHLITEYTETTATVDITGGTSEFTNVITAVEKGYITIRDKTDESQKVVVDHHEIDLSISYLNITNYNVINNGKDLDKSNIQVNFWNASNSKAYYQYEKITDENVISKYKEIKAKNGDFNELQSLLKTKAPSSNWTTWEYWNGHGGSTENGFGYTQSSVSVPDYGLYYMWIYLAGNNIRNLYGYILVDNLQPEIALDSISLPKTKEVELGKTLTLTPTFSPENTTNKIVTWSSSDESVATVDNAGKITPKKIGSTIITVTSQDGNKKASCTVTVIQKANEPSNTQQSGGNNGGTTNGETNNGGSSNGGTTSGGSNVGTTNGNNNSNKNGSVQGASIDNDKKTNTSNNKPSTASSSKNKTTGKKDNTVSPTILPQTGLGRGIMVIVIIATVYGIYAYRKYNYLKDIK